MSGHSRWSTIKRKKGAADAKRGKVFTKLIREIVTAARIGGGEPNSNPRLRLAVDKARGANMTKDTIERAIKRGIGGDEGAAFEEVVYEGYGPGGTAIYVEVLTDNKNRTVGEVRHVLTKNGGNLGANGCVAYLFEKKGMIVIDSARYSEDDLMVAVEARRHAAEGDVTEAEREVVGLSRHAVRPALVELGAAIGGDRAHDLRGGRREWPHDDRDARLDDSGLLGGDAREVVAEDLHVVHSDRRDRGRERLRNDVRRIEPPAEADLEHRHVDLLIEEVGERRGGRDLEVGEGRIGVESFARGPGAALPVDALEELGERVVVDVDPADRDALVHLLEVRRRVRPDLQALRAEHRVEHAHDRALAVRAGDVDHRVAEVRVPERAEERPQPRQPEAHPRIGESRENGMVEHEDGDR